MTCSEATPLNQVKLRKGSGHAQTKTVVKTRRNAIYTN